jgi:DNA-binding IclR family transcriptional regulator
MTFKEWFYNASHRAKYTTDHPAYLAAQEAWEAAHEACAKVCEARYMGDNNREDMEARRCAAAIRARGNE